MSNLCHVLIYLSLMPLLISTSPNYYWREYTFGEIPEDAVIGGQNKNGDHVYIGQAYAKSNTLLVTQINPAAKEVVVWSTKKLVVDKKIKILCGSSKNFVWFFINGTDAELKENAVLGGHMKDAKVLIGRIKHDGGVKIGSIYKGFQWGGADDSEKRTAYLYEVLLYQETENSSIWEAQNGYYWREYDGTIPVDALPGGTDINRKNLYIGQATTGSDLVVVRISPGITEVQHPFHAAKYDKFIKILCGNPTNFEWISTTGNTIKISLIDKYGVIGGHQDPSGYAFVGRISIRNEIKIGMIISTDDSSDLYFYDNGGRRTISLYQVLTEK